MKVPGCPIVKKAVQKPLLASDYIILLLSLRTNDENTHSFTGQSDLASDLLALLTYGSFACETQAVERRYRDQQSLIVGTIPSQSSSHQHSPSEILFIALSAIPSPQSHNTVHLLPHPSREACRQIMVRVLFLGKSASTNVVGSSNSQHVHTA